MLIDAKDFFADGKTAKHKQIPILVMFSAPDCPYCELVKREVIVPMSELKEYEDKIILRHIFYSSLTGVVDFSNQISNHSKFSFSYNASFYPTLMLLDSEGEVLNKKIGITLIDTYWTELDTLIEQATRKIRAIL